MKYRIGTDKILCRIDSPLVEGWEEVTDLQQLKRAASHQVEDIQPSLRWLGSKIPLSQISRVLGTIKQFPHTECGFVLEYRAEDGAWNIEATEQQGFAAFVHWEDTVQHDGFMSMGTIHTHPEMNAFFSGTDHNNDKGQYGVHIVLGLTDGDAVRTACRIYTPYSHCDIPITDVCEEFDPHATYEPVQEWVALIKKGIERPKAYLRDMHYPWTGTDKEPGKIKWDKLQDAPGFRPLRDFLFQDDELEDVAEDTGEEIDWGEDYDALYGLDLEVDELVDEIDDVPRAKAVLKILNELDDTLFRTQMATSEELQHELIDLMLQPAVIGLSRKARLRVFLAACTLMSFTHEDELVR